MKYDMFHDDVIVKLADFPSPSYIRLIKEKIKEFSINKTQFIYLSSLDLKDFPKATIGFYEILYKNSVLSLYIKHTKSKHENLDRDYRYYEFKEHTSYLLCFNKRWFIVKGKRDFINIFSEYKNSINNFYKLNRNLRKTNYNEFLESLIGYINNLAISKTSDI